MSSRFPLTFKKLIIQFCFILGLLYSFGTPIKCLALANPNILKVQNCLNSDEIGGLVFHDYNSDGLQTNAEPGINAITISLYGDTNSAVFQAISAPDGTFLFQGLEVGQTYRVEVNLPSGFFAASSNGGVSSNVQFITTGNCEIVFPIITPLDYCEDNPSLATNCYMYGGLDGTYGTGEVLVSFPLDNSHENDSDAISDPNDKEIFANHSQIGSTYGLAYNRKQSELYAGAFVKRHSALGPNGTGAIYSIDVTGINPPSLFVDLNAEFGPETAGANPHDFTSSDTCPDGGGGSQTNFACWFNDVQAWDAVGRSGLGDIDIDPLGEKLYAINLADRKLYEIPTSNPSASNINQYDFPESLITVAECAEASSAQPFAVKYHEGNILVGASCTDENQTDPALGGGSQIFVFELDLATGTWAKILSEDIQRGFPSASRKFYPWTSFKSDPTDFSFLANNDHMALTDIEIDGNAIVLGIRDLAGDQWGSQAGWPISGDSRQQFYTTQGDIFRACKNSSGVYEMEENGSCGGTTTAGAGSGYGIAGNFSSNTGSYYHGDFVNNIHPEISLGGLVQVKGHSSIYLTAYEMFEAFEAGVIALDNQTGERKQAYLLIDDTSIGGAFGKSGSLGDLEALCNEAPIEIGNRVWTDSNGDGIQDANEPGLANINLGLYLKSGSVYTLVGITSTSSAGEYVFNMANVDSTGVSNLGTPNSGSFTGIPQNETLIIAINDNSQFNTTTQELELGSSLQYRLTTKDAPSGTNSDWRDSDAEISTIAPPPPFAGFPIIEVNIGGAGESSFNDDFGFMPIQADLELTKTVNSSSQFPGDTITYTLTVVNQGPEASGSFTVEENFPAGLTLLSVVPETGSWSNPTWAVGNLAANDSTKLVIQGSIQSLGTHTNWAQIQTATLHDPDSDAGNLVSLPTLEDDEAAVSLDIVCPQITLLAASPTSYCDDNIIEFTVSHDAGIGNLTLYYSETSILPADLYNASAGGATLLQGDITSTGSSTIINATLPENNNSSDNSYMVYVRLDDLNPNWISPACLPVQSTTITAKAKVTSAAGIDQVICEGSDVTLGGAITGTTIATWTTSGDGAFDDASSLTAIYTPGANDITAGTVDLILTTEDPAGPCEAAIDSLVLTINREVTADAGVDLSSCEGSDVTLGGAITGTTIATWTTSGDGAFDDASSLTAIYTPGTNDITAGTVDLILTTEDPAGPCEAAIDSLVLTINGDITADAGVDLSSCEGSDLTLGGSITGTTVATWTTSGDGAFDDASSLTAIYTPGANDITAGTVDLILTTEDPAGPCEAAVDSLVLTINGDIKADAGADLSSCEGSDLTLGGTITGTTVATWTTSGDGTFDDASSLTAIYTPGTNDITAGTVDLILTTEDPAGPCEAAIDSLVLTINREVTADAGVDLSSCEGSDVTLGGVITGTTVATWTTSGDGVFDDASSLTAIYTPGANDITAGTVDLILTTEDPAGPCEAAIDSLVLTIEQSIILDAGIDQSLCSGDELTLVGSTSATVETSWSTSGSGSFADSTDLNSAYTLSAADEVSDTLWFYLSSEQIAVCDIKADSMLVVISETFALNIAVDSLLCFGDTLALSAPGTYDSLLWTTTGFGVIENTKAGETYYVTDDNDLNATDFEVKAVAWSRCGTDSLTQSIELVGPILVDAGADQLLQPGDTIFLDGGVQGSTAVSWSTSTAGTFEDSAQLTTFFIPDAPADSIEFILSASNSCFQAADTTEVIFEACLQISLAGPGAICQGDSILISFSLPDSLHTDYLSSNGAGNFSKDNDSTVIYIPITADFGLDSLTFEYEKVVAGCAPLKDSLTVFLDETLNASVSDSLFTICASDTVQLNGNTATGSGQWITFGDGSFTDATALSTGYLSGSQDQDAAYVKLALIESSTCSTDTAFVEINIQQAPIINVPEDQSICETDSIQLEGMIDGDFLSSQWQHNGSGSIVNADATNSTYITNPNDFSNELKFDFIVTSETCEAVTASFLVNFNQNTQVSISSVESLCGLDTAFIDIVTNNSDGDLTWSTSGSGTFGIQDDQHYYLPSAAELGDTINLSVELQTACGNAMDSLSIIFNENVDFAEITVTDFTFGESPSTPDIGNSTPNGIFSLIDQGGLSGEIDQSTGELTNLESGGQYIVEYRTTGACEAFARDTLNVIPAEANEPPIANDDAYTISINSGLDGNVVSNDSDPDGDEIYSLPILIVNPTNGSVSVDSSGVFTYNPDLDFLGQDTFTYLLCDDGVPQLCDTAVVTIDVVSSNMPPIAADDSIHIDRNEVLVDDLSHLVFDPNGDELVITLLDSTSRGSLILNDQGGYSYTPDVGFIGIDTFTYVVCDNGIPPLCDTAQVIIVVDPLDGEGIDCTSEDLVTEKDTSVDGQIECVDLPPGMFQVILSTEPEFGQVDFDQTGFFTYTPNLAYLGFDAFRFTICDTFGRCTEANVKVEILRPDLKIYNAISPNDDGLNETWEIENLECYLANEVQIFNRWGNLVWRTENYENQTNNWSGESNEGLSSPGEPILPDGTYYYIIKIWENDRDGESLLHSGYIELHR